MGENESDILQQVQYYRKVVLMYEALDEEIDALIMAHGGTSDGLSSDDMVHYRELARQRDELLNEMRTIEQQLLDDDQMEK